ncbi:hypothetical protein ZHAS_00001838 [Anopheles sinensis]|uniref:Uncharacterized protein n=1 Tax=Anopheles sinensis TaxID=74873 RepID=A0A084VBK6_ANOSI|nr:hypothetical protein ZHAS_00001838 [Anopheles sinensis]
MPPGKYVGAVREMEWWLAERELHSSFGMVQQQCLLPYLEELPESFIKSQSLPVKVHSVAIRGKSELALELAYRLDNDESATAFRPVGPFRPTGDHLWTPRGIKEPRKKLPSPAAENGLINLSPLLADCREQREPEAAPKRSGEGPRNGREEFFFVVAMAGMPRRCQAEARRGEGSRANRGDV